ncbi:MAG: YtxH domain-containing protein [Alkalibacterium sp.]|uniref:Gas vesicle protein n=1 Tax=Alkalibacterium gilvum TaxID=1130080 RepID=A0A1H6RGH7_9LACT|nr:MULTISPECIES: YtxH domain-containing protein [Alkalibacterium]MDN6293466.1 YtxH domain-containing protein [Alkalibacterium sp.]MDN6295191.1 YtxH domain-containing protein [Alkalibacterium sp.]MDN6327080.1 YtxH domain-containing protein [Alkalibacterium sp.]MDN6728920.1 YtxH domain-containing protein [Alkalibacterium sp.]SEI52414.1 Gas vesicle protein [Alkalibacterium gilvum]
MLIDKVEKAYEVKGFVLGTFVGAAVAGITALLLAPKSGKEVRSDIKEQGIKTKDQAKDYVDKAKDKGLELKDSISKKSDDYMEDASENYEELSDEAEKNLDKIKKQAKDTAEKVKAKMNNNEKATKKNDPTAPDTTSRAVNNEANTAADSSPDNKTEDVKTDTTYFNPDNK